MDASTLYRWRRETAFAAELNAQLAARREHAQTLLLGLVCDAVDALRTVLRGQSEAARIAAARTVLDRIGLRTGNAAESTEPRLNDEEAVEQLADPELTARVRRHVFSELEGRSDRDVLAIVRSALGEAR